MELPTAFLQSLEGLPGFTKESFVQVHEKAKPPTSIRMNQVKAATGNQQSAIGNEQETIPVSFADYPFPVADWSLVPWCTTGFYLDKRPSFTFDPLFHAGCYYVQEASSMFLEQALKQLVDLSQPIKALDLCAAPGGKSTHIQSLLSPDSLLVSNEVIKQRSLALTDNIIRWGCNNVFVSNNDPKTFQNLPHYFDVLVVDAPCSGSGLFRKDVEAVEEWSLNNVALCSQRQQRILADALPCLKGNGLLVYSTCSYSEAEDEVIADWLVSEMALESLSLSIDAFEGIVETASPQAGAKGYRFYPDKVKGEGFFLACFRKKIGDRSAKFRPAKLDLLTAREKKVVEDWIGHSPVELLRFRQSVFAIPKKLLDDFAVLSSALHLQYAGIQIGEVLRDKLVPHHALAQSGLIKKSIAAVALSYEDAIRYLQRQELLFQPQATGWHLAQYKGHNLGWMNVLKNRVNNYYPKEIRILKQRNDTAFEK